MASEKVSQVIDLVGGLTVLELNDLVKELQEQWGVTAAIAAPVANGIIADGGTNGAAPEPEQTEFTVVLKEAGAAKIQVIKAVREVVSTLGLKEAKDLVDGAPATVKDGLTKEDAQKMKEKLEGAGATVEIK